MKVDPARLVWEKMFAAVWVTCGCLLMSLAIVFFDAVQGIVLDDWSGIHPIRRLYSIPKRIFFSALVPFIVGVAAILAHCPPLNSRLKQMAFGATCGLVTVVSLLEPWVSRSDEFSYFTAVLTLPVALWVRVSLVRSNVR